MPVASRADKGCSTSPQPPGDKALVSFAPALVRADRCTGTLVMARACIPVRHVRAPTGLVVRCGAANRRCNQNQSRHRGEWHFHCVPRQAATLLRSRPARHAKPGGWPGYYPTRLGVVGCTAAKEPAPLAGDGQAAVPAGPGVARSGTARPLRHVSAQPAVPRGPGSDTADLVPTGDPLGSRPVSAV